MLLMTLINTISNYISSQNDCCGKGLLNSTFKSLETRGKEKLNSQGLKQIWFCKKSASQSNRRKQYLTSLWMTGSPEEEQQHKANDKKRADSNDCQR